MINYELILTSHKIGKFVILKTIVNIYNKKNMETSALYSKIVSEKLIMFLENGKVGRI